MMKELMAADGVFYGCSDDTHNELATMWEAGDQSAFTEVQQEAPIFHLDDKDRLISIDFPEIDGVAYTTLKHPTTGETIAAAIPKQGYRLKTGHRERRPHGGALPTELMPPLDEETH